MGLPLEKIGILKGKELRDELSQLRGAHAFTTHNGKVPNKIKNKDTMDDSGNKKKFIIIVLVLAGAAYVYLNMG